MIDEAPAHPSTLEEQIEDIVMDAFTVVDELANDDLPQSDDETDDEPLGDDGCRGTEGDNYGDPRVLEDAIEELYHGAKSSILAATILIMTLCTIHGVSNQFADQLFILFREHLLPSENMLPKNLHAAKVLIQKLGLNYNTIRWGMMDAVAPRHAKQVAFYLEGNMKAPQVVQSVIDPGIEMRLRNRDRGKC